MIARINIVKIVVDHFKTLSLYNDESKNISIGDSFLFVFCPLLIAFFLTLYDFTFEKQLANLIAGVAIFGGFLFNLLAIIYSQLESIERKNSDKDDPLYEVRKKFVSEIHINISFCIVLSVFLILGLLLSTIDMPFKRIEFIFKRIIIGIDYYLLILFFLSLLMVLNRIYILLKRN